MQGAKLTVAQLPGATKKSSGQPVIVSPLPDGQPYEKQQFRPNLLILCQLQRSFEFSTQKKYLWCSTIFVYSTTSTGPRAMWELSSIIIHVLNNMRWHSGVKIAVLCGGNSGTVMHVRRVHVQHLQLEFTFLFCPNYRISLTADIWAITYHLCCVAKHIVGSFL